jgi:hypothetical protein
MHKRFRVTNENWFTLFTGLNDNYRYEKMYTVGGQRLDEELDILNIVKKLRKVDIILQNSLLKQDERKKLVQHTF